MPMKYTKLFERMKEHGLTTYQIRQRKMIGELTLQNLRKNRPVNTSVLCRFCKEFQCQPGDIMEYFDDGNEE